MVSREPGPPAMPLAQPAALACEGPTRDGGLLSFERDGAAGEEELTAGSRTANVREASRFRSVDSGEEVFQLASRLSIIPGKPLRHGPSARRRPHRAR
jgi:hypothetical protein